MKVNCSLQVCIVGVVLSVLLNSCTTIVENKSPIGQPFPEVVGTSLDDQKWSIPKDLGGKKHLLLIGYVQDSQFDIDRWLIGVEQFGYQLNVLEIPTIRGFFPKLISGRIDAGMRKGIPNELWKVVVTVYQDSDKIVNFTGNENPRNARVVVLDERGQVAYFHDRGFSVGALKQLGDFFPRSTDKDCPE